MTQRTTLNVDDGCRHNQEDKVDFSGRFDEVLKFHPPGLAAVCQGDSAWHIHPGGTAAYTQRFKRTFGFYQGLAAVEEGDGWHHIKPNGSAISTMRYAWCGNFQDDHCAVRDLDGAYFHITMTGDPAYGKRWTYAGDFRDGIGVVQAQDGLSTHIDHHGTLTHGKWFEDLDVFHKGFARARDEGGWMHIDSTGTPAYKCRFAALEPFYNGQARAERHDGGVEIINESGLHLLTLKPIKDTAYQKLSRLLTGFWGTQVVRTAAELRIIDCLPATLEQLAESTALSVEAANHLMRALWELDLVSPQETLWVTTNTGALLHSEAPISFREAALLWGAEHYTAWSDMGSALASGDSSFQKQYGKPFFEWLAERPEHLENYHSAMQSYAQHDYVCLMDYISLKGDEHILDACGGSGTLVTTLLAKHPNLTGTLLDRPEVIDCPEVAAKATSRLQLVGADCLEPWPCQANVAILARVLHDWADDDAQRILSHARQAVGSEGCIVLVEQVLSEETSNGALLNLNMLTMCGSRERTAGEWSALCEATDLQIVSMRRLPTYGSVLVLTPITAE